MPAQRDAGDARGGASRHSGESRNPEGPGGGGIPSPSLSFPPPPRGRLRGRPGEGDRGGQGAGFPPLSGGNVRRTKGATPYAILNPMIPLIQDHTDDIAEICRRHHVKRLELFGSAAVGDFNPQTSDLDFLVDYHPFSGPGKADAYFGLLEDLQQLFDRQIDLVVDRAIENPYFRQSVDASKVAIYES